MFSFNPFGGLEKSEVYLCNTDKSIIGAIPTDDLSYKLKWNTYSEISFSLNQKYNDMLTGETLVYPTYPYLEQLKKVYVKGKGYYILQEAVEVKDGEVELKSCVAFSSEYELTQKYLEDFIINAGEDGSIDGVVFYDPEDKEHSLLNLVLEKEPNWKIGVIHDSLKNLERSFDISRSSLYDFLMNDVSNTFKCVFIFDTINNEISAYPSESAGEDTDIYISMMNLAKTIKIDYNADDIRTVLKVTGADGLSIRDVNLGLPYIMDLSYYHSVDWMGQELFDAYGVYQEKLSNSYEEYSSKLNEIYQLYDERSELENRVPSSLDSTDWREYGLKLLKEKENSYKNIQEVQAESGWGNESNENYDRYNENFNLLSAVQEEKKKREEEIFVVNQNIDNAFLELSAIAEECSIENNFNEDQLKVLSSFMKEDEYNDSNFLIIESDTDEDVLNVQKELLKAGEAELKKLCSPQFLFSADIEDLFAIPEFAQIKDKFTVGNSINVEVRDGYVMKARLLEIDIKENQLNSLSVTFGNLEKLRDQTDIHAELLSQAASAGKSVASNSSYWQRGADKATETEKRIERGLIDAATSIKSPETAGQAAEWDTYGIHLRKFVDGVLQGREGWITNNQILYTSDNFKTINSVFGEYVIDGQNYWGLLAEAVISGYIEGSTIVGGIVKSKNYSSEEEERVGSQINLEDGTFDLAGGKLFYDGSELKISADKIILSGNPAVTKSELKEVTDSIPEKVGEVLEPYSDRVNEVEDKIDKLNGYIEIDPSAPSVTLGKIGGTSKVAITDTSVTITGGAAEAKLESSKMSVDQAEFSNAKIGGFAWVHRTSNNHLSLKWVGVSNNQANYYKRGVS